MSAAWVPALPEVQIPVSSPGITAAEIEAVNQVLQTPYLSIGPRIAELEERFAAYACPEPSRRVGARHAVGVSSGTADLHPCVIAALRGELVEPDDPVQKAGGREKGSKGGVSGGTSGQMIRNPQFESRILFFN